MKITAKGWKTKAAIIAVVAVAAVGMTGCTTSSPSSSVGSSAKQTINWWSWNPDNSQDKGWISAFEKEHPNITVKHRFIQIADYPNDLPNEAFERY